MDELKEVKIGKSFSEIKEISLKHFNSRENEIPEGFSKEGYFDLRKSFFKSISEYIGEDVSNKPLIMTGHQPEFHHPGILWKDFLTCKIASDIGGVAIHLSVDTDEFEIGFNYPEFESSGDAQKKHLLISSENYGIYKNSNLAIEDKEKLRKSVQIAKKSSEKFLTKNSLLQTISCLTEIEKKLDSFEEISTVLENQRIAFLKNMGVRIHSIPVSFLITLPAFKIFSKKIQENLSFFIKIFNQSLHEYRFLHKIKNPAQPLPEIKEGDMPFWVLDEKTGKRIHVPESYSGEELIPRAITLTMFIRIFLADFFIHGTGGGRYEAISDNVLLQFFQRGFCDYTISTATMNLTPVDRFSLSFPDEKTIENSIRDLKHSPEKFLSHEDPLVMEKKSLFAKFQDPTCNKKEIHTRLVQLNEKMSALLTEEKKYWEKEKLSIFRNGRIAEIFQSRDFPYFYYNISELQKFAKNLS